MNDVLVYHIYTINPNQAKKRTVGYTGTKEEAEVVCAKNVLFGFEPLLLDGSVVFKKSRYKRKGL